MKVVITMGSKGDPEWSKEVKDILSKIGIESTLKIASEVPLKVLEIVKEYESEDVVSVTVAGRSNALSGFIDAHTVKPVIACTPYSDKFAGADIFSSLRTPSGVCPMVVLEPEQAAIAAAKIQEIREYQEKKKREIEEAGGNAKMGSVKDLVILREQQSSSRNRTIYFKQIFSFWLGRMPDYMKKEENGLIPPAGI